MIHLSIQRLLKVQMKTNPFNRKNGDQDMKILITGAKGFVGKNLVENLKNIKEGKNRTRDLVVDSVFEY